MPKDGTPRSLQVLIAETVIPQIEKSDGSRFFFSGNGLLEVEFEATIAPEYEQHHFIEACYCLKGKAEIWIDGRLKTMHENDLLVLPANLRHSPSALHCITCPPEEVFSRLLWLSPFPYGAILSLCESRNGEHFGTPRHFFPTPHVNSCFQDFVMELNHRNPNFRAMAKYNLLRTLMWICRAESTPYSEMVEPDDGRVTESGNGNLIDKVKDFIHQHYNLPLDLDSVSRAVAVSKSVLCRSFKKETGASVIDYLIRVRIDSGKRLIMSGLKVSDVAQLVGFQDPYYFSRMFKKVTGSSPKSFKESESTE